MLKMGEKFPLETRNWKLETVPTGPSTNGRSSAFGALCLGSNPSGPARKTVVGCWSLVVGNTGSPVFHRVGPTNNDERPTTKLKPRTGGSNYGDPCYCSRKETQR